MTNARRRMKTAIEVVLASTNGSSEYNASSDRAFSASAVGRTGLAWLAPRPPAVIRPPSSLASPSSLSLAEAVSLETAVGCARQCRDRACQQGASSLLRRTVQPKAEPVRAVQRRAVGCGAAAALTRQTNAL